MASLLADHSIPDHRHPRNPDVRQTCAQSIITIRMRCKPARDGVGRVSLVDMRALVAVRLLGLSTDTSVEHWLKNKRRDLLAAKISDFDRALIRRLWPR